MSSNSSYRSWSALPLHVYPPELSISQLKDVALKAIGWSIRYFMILRENYFGSFTHFSTLYEYLERRGRGLPPGDPDLDKYRPGTVRMVPRLSI